MKILFESYPYETVKLENFLSERYFLPLNGLQSKIHYVGYFHDPERGESVMVLPKVFLHPSVDGTVQVFGCCSPEKLLEIDADPTLRQTLKKADKLEFLHSINTWIFTAIRQYARRHPQTLITEEGDLSTLISNLDDKDTTELEIVHSLTRFNRDNQQLFTYIKKFNSSQKNTVSWSKTIKKHSAILQNGVPIYLDTVTKNKKTHYDEELLIIFFSVLYHFNDKYYLNVPLNPLYPVRKGAAFALLRRKGTRILKQIKYKYFNDKLLKLWHLLYLFFEQSDKAQGRRNSRQQLLIRDFNLVFEDMVDVLLSEPNLPRHLKEHKDGKEIDHIYPYRDLLTDYDQIYHIGDSKYYGAGTKLSVHDVTKQYTYARNVIQYNVDWLNDGRANGAIRYRDPLTEGYNPTPNFFIRAFVKDTLDFQEPQLTYERTFRPNRHFANRLFDRDTLLLQSYNINFLYVLASYVSGSSGKKKAFKENTRFEFRQQIVHFLLAHYDFYKLTDPLGTDTFLDKNFRLLYGKLYRPSGFENSFLLALEKNEESAELLSHLKAQNEVQIENFIITLPTSP